MSEREREREREREWERERETDIQTDRQTVPLVVFLMGSASPRLRLACGAYRRSKLAKQMIDLHPGR